MATTKQVSNKVKQRTQYFKSYLQGKMPIGTKLPTSLPSIFKVTSIAPVVLNNFWTWDVAQLIECFLNLYKVLGSTVNTNKTGCRSKGLNSHTLGMSWVWTELSIPKLLSKKEKNRITSPRLHSTTAIQRALIWSCFPTNTLATKFSGCNKCQVRALCDLHNNLNPQNSKGAVSMAQGRTGV